MRRSTTQIWAIAMTGLLAASACGGDDDADDAPAVAANADTGESTADGDAESSTGGGDGDADRSGAGDVDNDGEPNTDGEPDDGADDGRPVGSGTATVADQSWSFEDVSCFALTDFAVIDPSPSTSGDVTLEVRYDPQNGDEGLVDVRAADDSFSWYGDGFGTGTSSVTISVVDDVVRVEGTVIDNFAPTVDKPVASIDVEVFC